MIGSIKRLPTPRSQKSGRIVKGPKKPTLPQLVAKFEPIISPAASAAKAAAEKAEGLQALGKLKCE